MASALSRPYSWPRFPVTCRPCPRRLTLDTVARLRAKVDEADLEAFAQLAKGRKLQQFANALGEACELQEEARF